MNAPDSDCISLGKLLGALSVVRIITADLAAGIEDITLVDLSWRENKEKK